MLVDFLFGRKNSEGKHHVPPASILGDLGNTREGQPHYSPVLVADLKADHQALLQAFDQIVGAHAAGDLVRAAFLLDDLRRLLQAHFLKEDGRLYFYLEHALKSDSATHALVHDFHAEADHVGQAVLDFIDAYRDLAATPTLADSFAEDLESIGKALRERIHREETVLYPMYLPAY